MDSEKLSLYLNQALDFCVTFAPKILMAIISLYIGLWLAKKIVKIADASLKRTDLSQEVRAFTISFLNIGIKIFVVLFAAGFLGFEMTAILGVLAGLVFAIGMALQGSLSNFAAGIIIMVLRPYKIGDMVEIADKFGKVEEISIFNTVLGTPGKKTLIVPNGKIIEETITNFSEKGAIRLELNISMPYEESFPRVKEVILNTLKTIPVVLPDPVPEVGIETFDSHNIILTVRPFVLPDDYWEGTFESMRLIKQAFNNNNIKVAYSEGIEIGPIGE